MVNKCFYVVVSLQCPTNIHKIMNFEISVSLSLSHTHTPDSSTALIWINRELLLKFIQHISSVIIYKLQLTRNRTVSCHTLGIQSRLLSTESAKREVESESSAQRSHSHVCQPQDIKLPGISGRGNSIKTS